PTHIASSLLQLPATTDLYTLSLHDALPISRRGADRERRLAADVAGDDGARRQRQAGVRRRVDQPALPVNSTQKANPFWRQDGFADRKSTRLNSSHLGISYAVFCLKKKKEKK